MKRYGWRPDETKPGPDTEDERNQMVLEIIRDRAKACETSDIITKWKYAVMERKLIGDKRR
jgi:hypothetical protein